jgi:Putative zinc-finger
MLNDEIIGAYLDGELTPELRAQVEQALASNKGAALRLESMRKADAAVREAMAAEAGGRDKDPLAALILSDWTPASSRRLPRLAPIWGRRAAALAAACLIGLIAGRTTAPQAPALSVSRDLAAVLDRTPSGTSVSIGAVTVQPALSFRAGEALCRQFRSEQGGAAADSIACRDGQSWRIVVQTAVVERATYQAASADDVLAATVDSMGGASVLDAEEERALIDAGWAAAD